MMGVLAGQRLAFRGRGCSLTAWIRHQWPSAHVHRRQKKSQ
jgi:hypothetical protein